MPEVYSPVDLGYHYIAIPTGNGVTSCDSIPGGALSIDSPSFCLGVPAFDEATWTDVPGQVSGYTVDSYGNVTLFQNAVYSTIVTNWNVVNWNGIRVTNGGSGFFFTPTNTGWGTNVFYYIYSNATPCSTGPYTISISNVFAVVGLASLAPATNGNWVEITNSTPGTRTFLVQANPTNDHNTLAVYATPTPSAAATNLPSCWSLNGQQTNVIVLSIAAPAVYQVDCVCGATALTDFFVVTTNAVATTTSVDTPCGTGPSQLGYWSFNPQIPLDYWAGESNALDTTGTNNGTITGNVTYTTNSHSGCAFNFNGSASYILIRGQRRQFWHERFHHRLLDGDHGQQSATDCFGKTRRLRLREHVEHLPHGRRQSGC